MKLNKKKGFTIVELVIVIGVIGILSAILIPTFANLTNKANDAKLKEELAGAYSAYVTDTIDGKVGESGGELVLKAQDKVSFNKNAKWYTYTAEGGWGVNGADAKPEGQAIVTDAIYLGFQLYY